MGSKYLLLVGHWLAAVGNWPLYKSKLDKNYSGCHLMWPDGHSEEVTLNSGLMVYSYLGYPDNTPRLAQCWLPQFSQLVYDCIPCKPLLGAGCQPPGKSVQCVNMVDEKFVSFHQNLRYCHKKCYHCVKCTKCHHMSLILLYWHLNKVGLFQHVTYS